MSIATPQRIIHTRAIYKIRLDHFRTRQNDCHSVPNEQTKNDIRNRGKFVELNFVNFSIFSSHTSNWVRLDWSRAPSRAISIPPSAPSLRALSVPARDLRASSLAPTSALSPFDLMSKLFELTKKSVNIYN